MISEMQKRGNTDQSIARKLFYLLQKSSFTQKHTRKCSSINLPEVLMLAQEYYFALEPVQGRRFLLLNVSTRFRYRNWGSCLTMNQNVQHPYQYRFHLIYIQTIWMVFPIRSCSHCISGFSLILGFHQLK